MEPLDLSLDDLLATTRSVRKRLDFSRPVAPEVIRECLELATQAPTGGNAQGWQFVVVTDPELRRGLGDIYRRGWVIYRAEREAEGVAAGLKPEVAQTQARVLDSATYLAEHIHEAPVLLIPCHMGRVDGVSGERQAGFWGSILPATWSFMLAARARGLGSAWTTIHLYFEREAAELLGIPYERVTQAAMLPVAYTLGTTFAPAKRKPLDTVLHWDRW